MGLLIIVLTVAPWGVDLLANWFGWLLIGLGTARLPATVGSRPLLLALAVVAGLVELALWLPALQRYVAPEDPSLTWVLLLPQVLYCLLLAWRLSEVAPDGGTRAVLRVLAGVFGLVAVLPVVFLGGDVPALAAPSYALAAIALVALVVCCFLYGGRDWALPAGAGRRTAR